MTARVCTCAETTYVDLRGDVQRVFHPRHSCLYVKTRNALIPAAAKAATGLDHLGIYRFHSERFIEEMTRRWAAIREKTPHA